MVLMLASASPARRRLLEQAGIAHRVSVSGVDEETIRHRDPQQLVQLLARAKADAVLERLSDHDQDITAVIGCDSLFVFSGEIFGKPLHEAQALQRWQQMAGNSGLLLTGHALLRGPSGLESMPPVQEASIGTVVHFSSLSQEEIQAYVSSGEPLNCAGGFALEGRGGLYIKALEGCYSNVIGLSLPWLRRALLV